MARTTSIEIKVADYEPVAAILRDAADMASAAAAALENPMFAASAEGLRLRNALDRLTARVSRKPSGVETRG